ncbi:MAG: hypothetical protein DI586_02690 [Micavibrio aeruginosavorus]|uniref:Uncharacterized protein n=1 Tax=Micavibrio aeruginosavorus TaxID=349221 RepID=A0A2W5FP58_9BACT|nr:MAG: hypothetical protein DI586_02690 [Micavibrio aeruginosavorus]
MTNRIATFPATERIIVDNMRLQSQLAETQIQLSTGLKSTSYTGIASDSQRLLNVERNYDSLEGFNTNATIIGGNIDIAYNAVKSILDLSNNFLQTLTSAQGGNFLDPQVTRDQGQLLIKEVAGLLNTQSAGRYLFAGSNIDTIPVNLDDPAFTPQTSPSTANTGYYQGNDDKLSAQLSETLSISYNFTANDPAFEQLLRSFNLAINNPSDTAALAESTTLMRSAISGMSNIFAQMSTFARTVENQTMRNEEDLAIMKNVIGNLKGADLAATTVRQKELETQIQASYASSVTILNLKLTDYI